MKIKKKTSKRIFIQTILIIVILIMSACGIIDEDREEKPNEAKDYEYSINGNEVSITKYIGIGEDVIIPDKIEDKVVTAIGYRAFKECKALTSIVIPNGVKEIGESTFSGCENLTSITLPDSLTKLEIGTFNGCKNLENIVIPNGVTEIHEYSFGVCEKLEEITIPASVKKIRFRSFFGCKSLKAINIESNKSDIFINYNIFSQSTLINYVKEGKIIESVEQTEGEERSDNDFEYEVHGDQVYIKKYIGSAQEVIIPDKIEDKPVVVIGNLAFVDCDSITSVTIPNGVTEIGTYAFGICTNLVEVKMPNSVSIIWDRAFSACVNLKEVEISTGIKEIDPLAFSENTNIIYIND